MEVLHDLIGYKNMKIYQNTDWFTFSLDSVLLPNFVTLLPTTKSIIDLGTGTAPIPLILSTRTKAKIVAVEIQKDLYKLAKKTIYYNHLENQIDLLHKNMLELKTVFDSDTFDVVISNPPYFKYQKNSYVNDDEHKTIARHEKELNISQLVGLAKYLLKSGGVFAIVHRTDRLLEILSLLSSKNLEVKKIQFIYPRHGNESNLVLIEAKKNGNAGLKMLDPLYVHYENGSYTEEVQKYFE